MEFKRVISMLLVLTILFSMIPTVLAENTSALTDDLPEQLGMKIVGTETTYSNGKKGIVFDIQLRDGGEDSDNSLGTTQGYYITGVSHVTFGMDSAILSLSKSDGTAIPQDRLSAAASYCINGLTFKADPTDEWSAEVSVDVSASTAFMGEDNTREYVYAALNVAEKKVDCNDYVTFAKVYCVFNDGKSLADIDKNSVSLIEDLKLLAKNNIASTVMIGDGGAGRNFGSVFLTGINEGLADTDNDDLPENRFELVYPRSEADAPIDVGGDVTKDETGTLTLPAPEKDKVYGATGGAPESVQVKLTGLTEGAETVKFEAGTIWTDDDLTFSIDADGKVTSNKPVPGSFKAQEVTIRANILDATAETETVLYTKTITATIPNVILPMGELTTKTGSIVEQNPAQTVSEVFDAILGDDAGANWTHLNEKYTDPVSKTEYVAVSGETTLTHDGGDDENGVYVIPVYNAYKGSTDYRASVDYFTLTVVEAPAQGSIDSLLTAEGAYTSTETSITFNTATNTGWEYNLTLNKPETEVVALADAPATVGDWKQGTTDGVVFDKLTSGTSYYLMVRAASAPDTVVTSTKAADTTYTLRVDSAELVAEGSSTLSTTTDETGVVSYSAKTETAVLPTDSAAAEALKQQIMLTNTNGNTLARIEAAVYTTQPAADADLSTLTASTKYTASVDPSENVASGTSFAVDVTPVNGTLVRGTNTEYLVITAYDGDNNELVRKVVTIDCVVYGNREGAVSGTDDIVLKPANTANADAAAKLAKANETVSLEVKIGEYTADSYELVTGARDGDNSLVELDGSTLKIKQDVTMPGLLATVKAKFDKKGADDYFNAEEKLVNVYVKSALSDELTGGEEGGTDKVYQDEYEVIIYVDGKTDETIDFAKDLGTPLTAGDSISVTPKTAITGATLAGTVLTIPKDCKSFTKGEYTVSVPATEKFDAGMIDVTIYVLENRVAAIENDTLVLAAGADAVGTVEAANGKEIDLTTIAFQVNGATYAGNDVTYALDESYNTVGGNTLAITDNKLTLPESVTDTAEIRVNVSIPKDTVTEGKFGTAASAVYTIKVLKPATLSVEGTNEYTKQDVEDGTAISLTVKRDGTDVTADATFAVDNTGILTVGADGKGLSLTKPNSYGKATVTVSVQGDSATYLDGTATVEIFVRKPAGEDNADIETGDPTNGTGATILGRIGNAGDFTIAFNAKMNDDDAENNKWNPAVDGVKYTGIKQGVSYQVRFLLEGDTDWFKGTSSGDPATEGNPTAEGWWTFGVISGETGATQDYFTWIPTDSKIVTAQIRYTPDGTVGDTTITPPTGDTEAPYEFTIHGMTKGVKYEYRILNADTATENAGEYTAWTEVPEDKKVDAKDGTQSYSGTHDQPFDKVETRYTSAPSISENDDFYTITGLIPNANYDITSKFVKDSDPQVENSFREDPVNYATRRADTAGTIRIAKAEKGENHDILVSYGEPPYLIRLSKTDSTEPGDAEEINTGVTVKGIVESYAPKRTTTLALFARAQDGNYPAYVTTGRALIQENAYQVITIGGDSEDDALVKTVQQKFAFENVEAGTYMLVIIKEGNTHYIVKDIVVALSDVDLTDAKYPDDVRKMTLIAGDLNNNGAVEAQDANQVFAVHWGEKDIAADLNNNGAVEAQDANIIFAINWGKRDYTASAMVDDQLTLEEGT